MLSDPKIIFGLCPMPCGCVRPSSASSAVSTATTASRTARSSGVMGFPGACSRRRKSADHFCLRCRARWARPASARNTVQLSTKRSVVFSPSSLSST